MGAAPVINRRLALALCWLLVALAVPANGQESEQKRVLVLTALRKDSPAPATIDRDFQRILGEGLAGELDYYSESIDLARFAEDDYQAALRDFLARKYQGTSIRPRHPRQ